MTTAFKTATDFRESLEARLKSIAEKTNQDLQRVRRKVAFERLLARIFYQEADGFVHVKRHQKVTHLRQRKVAGKLHEEMI